MSELGLVVVIHRNGPTTVADRPMR